jgi:polar amino acid transport system permease protein
MGSFFYYILLGTIVTIGVTLVALPFGLVIGLLMALLHTYGGKFLNRIAATYSILLRGVPPIVLLFILYFIISGSINLSPFWAGSISLGIVSSAYQMEILRGALLAVGGGLAGLKPCMMDMGSCGNAPPNMPFTSMPTGGLPCDIKSPAIGS